MVEGTFHIKVDHDGFKRLTKTMTGGSQGIKYKQISEDEFLVTFYDEAYFDQVWDRWWEDDEWRRVVGNRILHGCSTNSEEEEEEEQCERIVRVD